MARSYLDTSSFRERPRDLTGQAWAHALQTAASGIARGIERRGELKRQEANQFINNLAFDINDVSNTLMKEYAMDQYAKMKDKWVGQFTEQKGQLSPQQKVELQSDMNSLHKSVEYLNGVAQMNDRAMKESMKPGSRVTYKGEQYQAFVDLLKPKNGKYDSDAIYNAGAAFMESDSGLPGTTITPMNPDDALIALIGDYRQATRKETGVGAEKQMIDGQSWEAPYKTYSHGTPEDALSYVMTTTDRTGFLPGIEKGAAAMLTDEQKLLAAQKYGSARGAMVKYYYNDVNPSAIQGMTEETRDYGTIRRTPKPTGKKPKEPRVIKKTDIGYDFSSTPVNFITETDFGPTEAKVYKIEDRDGEMYVKMKYKIPGKQLTEIKEQPLREIYEPLGVGFEKAGLQLEGYGGIQFGAPPEEIKPVPDFRVKRVALMRSDDKEMNKQAIEFIQQNPDDPRSYQIYEKLKAKNVID